MTYSRKKYLNNEFDTSNPEEIKIYQKIVNENISGLKYNLFIKDYIIEYVRDDLMGINFFQYPALSELVYKLLPLLQLGMFNTIRQLFASINTDDDALLKLLGAWDDILKEANDLPDTLYDLN